MRYLKTYENFSDINILEGIDNNDISNFTMIFNSLYENHLTINEKILIDSNYGMINESWFSDLADKGKRGVLAVKSKAGELLVDLAKKAKDVLDFAKSLAGQIGNYVKTQFLSMEQKIKEHALKDSGFIEPLIEFIQKKKLIKLKTYITVTSELLKYIVSGQIITDLVTRLSEIFSNVLNLGTNEGLIYLDDNFLLENNVEEEKKSFLQRLGEKIMTYPPFNWIPKIEDLMKQGISKLSQLMDKFFCWLTTGKSDTMSKFTKSFYFIFQILELYIFYKVLGSVDKFKDFISKASGFDELTKSIQDKSMHEVWKMTGFNGDDIVKGIKSAVNKIPYVGSILNVLDTLVISVGIYMIVKPKLDALKIT